MLIWKRILKKSVWILTRDYQYSKINVSFTQTKHKKGKSGKNSIFLVVLKVVQNLIFETIFKLISKSILKFFLITARK